MTKRSDSKTLRLTVAVSEDEAAYIKRMAKDNDVTVSELIREVMLPFSE